MKPEEAQVEAAAETKPVVPLPLPPGLREDEALEEVQHQHRTIERV